MGKPLEHFAGPMLGIRRAAAVAAQQELLIILKRRRQQIKRPLNIRPTLFESGITH
jgi:hypothetical protein